MYTRTVRVGSSVGLHAVPAAIIAEAVEEAGVPVTMWTDDPDGAVAASSALLIMSLRVDRGEAVTVACHRQEVVNRIATLIEQDLHT